MPVKSNEVTSLSGILSLISFVQFFRIKSPATLWARFAPVALRCKWLEKSISVILLPLGSSSKVTPDHVAGDSGKNVPL